jgi:hypothetical protein
LSVKLWDIKSGLALDLGIKVIWVEADSMSAVKTINNDQPFNQKVANCMRKFEKYQVSHSWREANRVGDHLVKMVLLEIDYMVLLHCDFPSGLCKIIKADIEGKIYCKGSNEVLCMVETKVLVAQNTWCGCK